jgi:hypothetical protein
MRPAVMREFHAINLQLAVSVVDDTKLGGLLSPLRIVLVRQPHIRLIAPTNYSMPTCLYLAAIYDTANLNLTLHIAEARNIAN